MAVNWFCTKWALKIWGCINRGSNFYPEVSGLNRLVGSPCFSHPSRRIDLLQLQWNIWALSWPSPTSQNPVFRAVVDREKEVVCGSLARCCCEECASVGVKCVSQLWIMPSAALAHHAVLQRASTDTVQIQVWVWLYRLIIEQTHTGIYSDLVSIYRKSIIVLKSSPEDSSYERNWRFAIISDEFKWILNAFSG